MIVKTLFLFLFAMAFAGCGNSGDAEKARQDSISEAAAADSMLQDALSADSIPDTLKKADTTSMDSLE